MDWTVAFTRKASKQAAILPERLRLRLMYLVQSIRESGPTRPEMRHYGKLRGAGKRELHHCHLNKGRPTYVAVWEVTDRTVRLVEITYVGSHEDAPY